MRIGRIALATAVISVAAGLGAEGAHAQGRLAPRRPAPAEQQRQAKAAAQPALTEAQLLESWREVKEERTARRRVFISPDGTERRGLVSTTPRWNPVTGEPISADLRFEGAGFASDQGEVRIEAPLTAGPSAARLLFASGEAVEVSTRVRLVHGGKGAGEGFARTSGEAPAQVRGGAALYAGVLDGADLLVESRPGELESSLVLAKLPEGLAAGARGAVWFEEAITLPRGWQVDGLEGARESGIVPGLAAAGGPDAEFVRIDAHLYLVDGLGDTRVKILGPRVYEAGRPKADSGAFAEVRFDAATQTLVYRTAVPARWLADPARRFPVVFDPTLVEDAPAVLNSTLGQVDTWTITAPSLPYWNIVGVSAAGSADYDIFCGAASGEAVSPFLDFVIADANKGTMSPTNGTTQLFTAVGPGTLEHDSEGFLTPGTAKTFTFRNTEVLEVFDINVTTAGQRQIRIDGPSGLYWALFPPGASTGTGAWDDEFSAIGFADFGQTITIDLNVTGYWGLAIFEDGGPGLTGQVNITWPSSAVTFPLTQDTARTVTAPATGSTVNFTLTPKASYWNAVGVIADDWDVTIGPATSQKVSSTVDFCVFDGNGGKTVSPTAGTFLAYANTTTALAEHAAGQTGAIVPGTNSSQAWSATDILRVYEINANGGTGFGTYTLTVNGITNVRCALFAPTSSASWLRRDQAVVEFAAGTPQSINLANTGIHNFYSVAVFRDGVVPPVVTGLSFDWGSASNPAPTTTSISPTNVTAGTGSFTITVTGTNFVAGSIIRLDGADRTPTTLISPTQLSATILATDITTSGTRQITVFTPTPGGGTSNAQTLAVDPAPSNPAPSITSISPTHVTAGAAQFTLTVNGSGFISGSTVRANGSALSTSFGTSSLITAQVPAASVSTPQTIQITVFNAAPGGGTSTAFTLTVDPQPTNPVPSISSISPSAVTAGAAQFTLTVNGSSFVSGAAVRVNGSARTTVFGSATQLTATIPASDVATQGSLSITVFNPSPGGGTSNAQALTVNPQSNPAPTLASIAPTSVAAGSGQFTLTANGTGFVAGQSVLRVGGSARTTTVVSPTQLTATILATDVASAGSLTITVFTPTPGGGTSAGQTLTVSASSNPAPTLASISPTHVTAGSAQFTLTVNGGSFVAGAVVRVNGSSRTTTFVSASQLTATIPASDVTTAGSASITVFNPTPGGGTSAAQTLTIDPPASNPAPSVTSISPSTVFAGSPAFTLQVNGTGFVSASVVRVNGSARATTFVSATRLDAGITAADLTSPATLQISVFSPAPGGGTSGNAPLDVQGLAPLSPVLSSISPSSVPAGSAGFTMTVNGSNFGVACVVRVNGSALSTTFVSTTTLTADVPASTVASFGNRTITVFDGTTGLSSGTRTLSVTSIGGGGGIVGTGNGGSGGGGGGCAIASGPASGAAAAGSMLPWAIMVAGAGITRARRRRTAQ